jgi:transcriptional regulator with XRE-family HTH domain
MESLWAARKRNGIDQKELGRRLSKELGNPINSAQQLISRWESGKAQPSPGCQAALCRVLGVEDGKIQFVEPDLIDIILQILTDNGVSDEDMRLITENPASHKPFAQAVLVVCEKLRTL